MEKRVYCILLLFFITLLPIIAATPAISSSETLKKIDGQGNQLPDDATEWEMVLDTASGLYWEVKKVDDSLHSNKGRYKNFEIVKSDFIAKLNQEKFGGFSDWRLPTTGELYVIRIKGDEPYIAQQFFPNTIPSKYWSQGWCGSESRYQGETVKFGKQKVKGAKYVRAVRGQPLE